MSLGFALLTAVGLAMDCFAVSLGAGTTRKYASLRSILRMSFHFGLFQGFMTLLGWLAGREGETRGRGYMETRSPLHPLPILSPAH